MWGIHLERCDHVQQPQPESKNKLSYKTLQASKQIVKHDFSQKRKSRKSSCEGNTIHQPQFEQYVTQNEANQAWAIATIRSKKHKYMWQKEQQWRQVTENTCFEPCLIAQVFCFLYGKIGPKRAVGSGSLPMYMTSYFDANHYFDANQFNPQLTLQNLRHGWHLSSVPCWLQAACCLQAASALFPDKFHAKWL